MPLGKIDEIVASSYRYVSQNSWYSCNKNCHGNTKNYELYSPQAWRGDESRARIAPLYFTHMSLRAIIVQA